MGQTLTRPAPPVSGQWQKQARVLAEQYLWPHRGLAVLLGICILAASGLELLAPNVLQWAIDATTGGTTVAHLRNLGVLYMIVMMATRAAQGSTEYLAADLSWRATNRLRGDLARHILRLPMLFHSEFVPGQLAERIDGDVGALGDLFSSFLLKLLTNIVFIAGAVGVLFAKDWRIGLTFIIALCCTALAYRKLANVAVPTARAERQAQAELMGTMEEDLRSSQDVRPLGGVPYLLDRFYQAARKHLLACRQAWPRRTIPFAVTMAIMGVNEALSLSLGIRLVQRSVFTIGTIYLIAKYSDLVSWPLQLMARQLGRLQTAGGSIQRIEELLAQTPEGTGARESETQVPAGALGVQFEGVTLAYPGGPPVLQQLELTLPPGHRLGVVGRTGCGKSSLVQLLLRLYEPTAGSVVLFNENGRCDLAQLAVGEVRRHVGLVTQTVQILAASVRDNLTMYGAIAGLTDEQLTWALAQVGLDGWLQALPQGLDTPLLTIAHRLSTLQRMDLMLVLDQGRVVEFGARAALAGDPTSRYHNLLRAGIDDLDAALELGE